MKEWIYDWGGANVAMFHALNANHAHWLDQVMLALTWAGDHNRFALYVSFIALVTWWRIARYPESPAGREWMLALATFAIAYVLDGFVVTGLKSYMDLPRPSLVFLQDSLVVVGPAEFHHSFPSGHASFAALFVASLWPCTRSLALRIALVVYVVAVCLSRPYLGFHFPADVLFGSLLSVLLVVGVRAALAMWRPPSRVRQVEL
jgi:membrane-associated phospholipid phosphatase